MESTDYIELVNKFIDNHIILHDYLYEIKSKDCVDDGYIKCIIRYNDVDLEYIFFPTNIIIKSNTIKGLHFIRLIKNKLLEKNYSIYELDLTINYELLTELLVLLMELIEKKLTDYCTICGKNESEYKKLNMIGTCFNPNCKKKYFHTVSDNIISDNFKLDARVCMFLIEIQLICLNHPKVETAYKPLPQIEGIESLKDLINLVNANLNKLSSIYLREIFLNSESDIEIYKILDNQIYALIKNALSSNYFSLVSKENVVDDNSITFININYPSNIEMNFSSNNQFLFHGSSSYSWYPIIKNGLKILSGTELQANGAVYGNGIYLSDSLQMSLGYSNDRSISNINLPQNNYAIVGIFRIKESIEQFKKVSGIYVISDDTKLLLKSLILINRTNTTNNNKIIGELTKYFTQDISVELNLNKMNTTMVKNKRLLNELKILQNKNFLVNIINENKWEISIDDIYKFEFNFLEYPIKAPNIILIRGNIPNNLKDEKNNLKIPLIHPANWTLQKNLLLIIEQIIQLIG